MKYTRTSHIILLCLLFTGAATVSPVIHNDDGQHTVHPLAHSAICKWVKDGKLLRVAPASADPAPFALISFVLLFICLPLGTAYYTRQISHKARCTGTGNGVRAPPLQI